MPEYFDADPFPVQATVDYKAAENAELRQGRCPYSGGDLLVRPMSRNLYGIECKVCDCFGFDADDPRIQGNRHYKQPPWKGDLSGELRWKPGTVQYIGRRKGWRRYSDNGKWLPL